MRWLALEALLELDEEEKSRGLMSSVSLSCQTILGVSSVWWLVSAAVRLKIVVPDGMFPALIQKSG